MSGDHEAPGASQAGLAADGPERTDQADPARIEQEVRARYAEQLAGADICDQLRIEVRIRAEIEQALAAAHEALC